MSNVDVVIDLGCQTYVSDEGREESIETLIELYEPKLLYGFDPHPDLEEGVFRRDRTTIVRSRMTAWMLNGIISMTEYGSRCAVSTTSTGSHDVRCFDLVSWLCTLPLDSARVVLKLDVEGAEYPLLRD